MDVFNEVFGDGTFSSYADFSERLLRYTRRSGRCFVIHDSRKTGSSQMVGDGERRKKGQVRKTVKQVINPTAEAKYFWVKFLCQHQGRRKFRKDVPRGKFYFLLARRSCGSIERLPWDSHQIF